MRIRRWRSQKPIASGQRFPADPSTLILYQIANKLYMHAVMDTLALVWTRPIPLAFSGLKKNKLHGRSVSGAESGQFDKQNCQKGSEEPLPNTGCAIQTFLFLQLWSVVYCIQPNAVENV